ncbi:hypothetical protein [Streptomyces sp. NPDC058953]|uniref:hypothetical protein n=1 Tax=unclassified Streptomyces TaxID=2593676 RepID=UPI0036C486D4
MTRTGQQRALRACLADAAAGITPPYGRDRVGVVLHSGTEGRIAISRLRVYARVRDWTVTAEATSWAEAERLVASSGAQGIVTDRPCTTSSALLKHCFVVVVEQEPHEKNGS